MNVCVHMLWIVFLSHSRGVRVKTQGLKATVSVCTPCNVVSLWTTCVNFNTPPCHGVCNSDARPVSKTIILRFVRIHRLKKTRSHLAECESFKNSSVVPTGSCPTNPVRQIGQNACRSIHPERRGDQLLSCTNTVKS